MTDGPGVGPEMGVEQPASKGITLYEAKDATRVYIPPTPNIPIKEGLHVEVASIKDVVDSSKEVLKRLLLGEGVAKVIAESSLTPDAWANTRLEKGNVVSIYGRVPEEEKSWRKPVDTLNRNAPSIEELEPFYATQKLQELSARYLPKWEKLLEKMVLFEGGVSGKAIPVSMEGESTVWKSDKFSVELIREPHINGYHLVVNPSESYERQWQTVRESAQDVGNNVMVQEYIQATLEATAIAMGVRQLLAGGRGEIHNSGNWAGGLRPATEGGKLDLDRLRSNIREEKRRHRPDLASDEEKFGTSMHVHVYIPDEGDVVILPPMSKSEAMERLNDARDKGESIDQYEKVIAQWDAIQPSTPDKIATINERLGENKLNEWLRDNAQGSLIVQNSQTPNAA